MVLLSAVCSDAPFPGNLELWCSTETQQKYSDEAVTPVCLEFSLSVCTTILEIPVFAALAVPKYQVF